MILGDWGQKFLGVGEGGSLEIHGPNKLSWTKITQTLVPNTKSFVLQEDKDNRKFFHIFEFDRDTGELIRVDKKGKIVYLILLKIALFFARMLPG